MVWIVRLVSIAPEGEDHSTDVMRIARPDTLADLGTLGLSLAEGQALDRLGSGVHPQFWCSLVERLAMERHIGQASTKA